MANKQKVCIVGGGVTGSALLWTLSQDAQAREQWDITLIHNQAAVGGHSLTIPVTQNGKTFPIDIGVQFLSPMLFPNVRIMLQRPEFKSRVPLRNYPGVKNGGAFPRDANNQPLNWGNFPEYQHGPNFALYSDEVRADIQTFQRAVEGSLLKGWINKTLEEYFKEYSSAYRNPSRFINYLLLPYLRIVDGYGDKLEQTTFMDMFPLFVTLPLLKFLGFPTPLASFSKPGVGFQRFAQGAQSWVRAMTEVAQSLTPSTLILNSSVNAVWQSNPGGQVSVQWQDQKTGQETTGVFDKVVLTTDMWTNSAVLNNPNNQSLWDKLYVKYVGYGCDQEMKPLGQPVIWELMRGMCYIHTDPNMLSPDLRQEEESLQFNAYYAPGNQNENYDLMKTYINYIQKNILQDPDADGLYLSMYGYLPDPAKGDKVPDPQKVLASERWIHARRTSSFMVEQKAQLHLAQGLGNISYPGQMNTNVYFAGNNTATDSEDGALSSAMAIANYALGVKYPLAKLSLESLFAYYMYKMNHDVMFPK